MKKSPWKYILAALVCLVLSPLLPLLLAGYISYKIYKSTLKWKGLIITTVIIASFFVLGVWIKLFPSSEDEVKHLPQNQVVEVKKTTQSAPTQTTSEVELASEESQDQNQYQEPKLEAIVISRVVDGDTVELSNGQKVRYIGIDTPETVDPNSPVGCFGKEASAKNKELVEGKEVRLEKDVSETDRYGRILRYVYIGDLFVNDYLVRQGYANASSYPPDIKYQDQFRNAEEEARTNNRGLWGSCSTNNEATQNSNTNNSTSITPVYIAPVDNSSGSSSSYSCNCSKTCTQISSCEEAQYQLNTCGCKVRDNDRDGTACDAAPLHCQN